MKLPRRPKHKKGFTWEHYFDEWWDRVGVEFRIKLILFILGFVVLGGVFSLYLWIRYYEKNENLEALQKRHMGESVRRQDPSRIQLREKSAPDAPLNPRED
jgi:hypothetical protein